VEVDRGPVWAWRKNEPPSRNGVGVGKGVIKRELIQPGKMKELEKRHIADCVGGPAGLIPSEESGNSWRQSSFKGTIHAGRADRRRREETKAKN